VSSARHTYLWRWMDLTAVTGSDESCTPRPGQIKLHPRLHRRLLSERGKRSFGPREAPVRTAWRIAVLARSGSHWDLRFSSKHRTEAKT
jgi:hypothetical protein